MPPCPALTLVARYRYHGSNAYACTPRINTFANDAKARTTLAASVGWSAGPAPLWSQVARLYASFEPLVCNTGRWRSVREVFSMIPEASNFVDPRALVHAGLLNGLIRRVQAGAHSAAGNAHGVV